MKNVLIVSLKKYVLILLHSVTKTWIHAILCATFVTNLINPIVLQFDIQGFVFLLSYFITTNDNTKPKTTTHIIAALQKFPNVGQVI